MSAITEEPRTVFRQTADSLASRISAGEFEVGSRLPPARELAKDYGVAPNTMSAALRLLRDQGVLAVEQGRGTFVRALPEGADPIAALRSEVADLRERVEQLEAHRRGA